MVRHNNVVPNAHFRKDWQERVKTWFNQPARKLRRRNNRKEKAVRIFPRPVAGPLRPVVHPPTVRYNSKVRLGRGFTLEELKAAGVSRHEALSIGIAVDHRRTNKSDKSFKTNVQRLKEYKSKLVLFPKKQGAKLKAGEASPEDQAKVTQAQGDVLPIRTSVSKLETVKLSTLDLNASAYTTLRKARSDARLVGIRKKRAEEKKNAPAPAAKKADKE